jgi:anti-anti-sigma factor
MFDLHQRGNVIILVPDETVQYAEFDDLDHHLRKAFVLLEGGEVKHAVIDLCRVERCGSAAIAYFVSLNKRVRRAGGRMVLCNVSEHLQEKVEVLHLDTLWPSCGSREDALDQVADGSDPNLLCLQIV